MENDKNFSRYLIDEHPITFHPSLAVALGINEAILLQKINLWLKCKPHDAEGKSWIYNTYKSWQEQLPFFSESTIRRTLKNLIDLGIVEEENFNKTKFDKTKWYTINYVKLDDFVASNTRGCRFVQIEHIDTVKLNKSSCSDCTNRDVQFEQTYTNVYTINNTMNTTDTEKKSKIFQFYEENIGSLNPVTAELLISYLDDMPEEMILEAIKIACLQNVRKPKYIGGILDDWRKKGYKVLADIQEGKNKTGVEEDERIKKRDEWRLKITKEYNEKNERK